MMDIVNKCHLLPFYANVQYTRKIRKPCQDGAHLHTPPHTRTQSGKLFCIHIEMCVKIGLNLVAKRL